MKMDSKHNDMTGEVNLPLRGGIGARHWQCILYFLGITIAYTNRICMSLAIVAIREDSKNTGNELKSQDSGTILSSFFWGYTLMQIPSGYMGRRWSAKMVLGIGILINGLSGVLCPLAYDLGGTMILCACRIVMGLSQAALLPCIHTLLSKWVPPNERSRLCSGTYAGAQFGTILAYLASGALIQKAGWRFVFYFWGTAAIIWSVVFLLIGSDSPSSSSKKSCCRISDPEKKYIESSLGVFQDMEKTVNPRNKNTRTPWKGILTSPPFWALVVVHCGQNWGFWMLLTEIPLYMDGVINLRIEKNGYISALPYIAMLALTVVMSPISDWCLKQGVPRGICRKVSNTIGHWGPALALLGLCFIPPSEKVWPIVILVVAVGLNAGSLCGFQINHMDLSPNYAGVLMSITNFFASIVAILAPLIAGYIITDPHDISQWRSIFYASTVIYFVGDLIFILFGSGKTQWWDDVTNYDENRNRNETSIRPRSSSVVPGDLVLDF